jgi:hypothetical protein
MPMDGEFCYPDFYWKVVDSLRGEEGQVILDRFNLCVSPVSVLPL